MRIFLGARYKTARPTAFLDRDGTINRNRHGEYITRPDQFELYDCTIPALKMIEEKGYQLVVLSNHSGIGRGYMSLETAIEINTKMTEQLKKAGVNIAGIYVCPHLPDAGCDCRKPKTGLLDEAISEIPADLKHSFVAGDSAGDIRLAAAANIPSYLVLTGAGRRTAAKFPEVRKYGTLLSLARSLPDVSKISN